METSQIIQAEQDATNSQELNAHGKIGISIIDNGLQYNSHITLHRNL